MSRKLVEKSTFAFLIILFLTPLIMTRSLTTSIDHPINIDNGLKDWTVLVYLCADNNLEYYAFTDLNEMEQAGGTTADVNIVSLIDRCETAYETPFPNDWSEGRYYTITQDFTNSFNSPMNLSLGEVNMGDPQTLRNFVSWGLANYPSDKTALIIWDHGNGLHGTCWDEDNGDDHLTIDELKTALDGYYLDFLGFDACELGYFEILYQLHEYCSVFVSSFLSVPGDGWDYFDTFSSLLLDPTMSAETLAEHTCEDYVDSYSSMSYYATLSAYNTSALNNIEGLVGEFVDQVLTYLPTYSYEFFNARASTLGLSPDYVCDFYEFLDNLNTIPESSLQTAISNLQAALDNALITSLTNDLLFNTYGLWIYLPILPYEYLTDFYVYSNQTTVNTYSNFFYGFDYVANTSWDNFLDEWISMVDTYIPTISTGTPVGGTLADGGYTYVQANLTAPATGYAYEATLTMDPSVDFDIHVWNEEYFLNAPDQIDAYSESGTGISEKILIPLNQPSKIFFDIYSYAGTGSFTLSLSVVEYVEDAYEENDDMSSAAFLDTNIEYNLISNDVDFFYVDLLAGSSVTITLDFNYVTVDLDLYLYDQSGTIIAYSEEVGSNEIIYFIPAYSGVFYILVNHYEGPLGENYYLQIAVSNEPSISNIDFSPSAPATGDTITVTCDVIAPEGINQVIFSYSMPDSMDWVNVSMTLAEIGGGIYTYSVSITAPDTAGFIQFNIYVEDMVGTWAVTPKQYIDVDSTESTIAFPWIMIPIFILGLAAVKTIKMRKK